MKLTDFEINPIKISILLLGLFIAYYLGDFANSILASIVIYVLCRPLLIYFIHKKKYKPTLASLLILLITVVVFLIPLTLIAVLLGSKINYLINNYAIFLQTINEQLHTFLTQYKIDLNTNEMLQKTASFISTFVPDILNATAATVTQIVIIYFTLYFMFKENIRFEKWILSFSPFNKDNTFILLKELKDNIYSNSIGIPVIGVIQAIVALIGYLIFGVDEPFLWAILTGLFSVIPIVGTTIIWLPLSLYLIISGDPIQGSGLLIYSVAIITNIDNVARLLILKKYGDVHPLITVFGVILGLRVFGFLGIILGPLVLSYLFLMIKMYQVDQFPAIDEASIIEQTNQEKQSD